MAVLYQDSRILSFQLIDQKWELTNEKPLQTEEEEQYVYSMLVSPTKLIVLNQDTLTILDVQKFIDEEGEVV